VQEAGARRQGRQKAGARIGFRHSQVQWTLLGEKAQRLWGRSRVNNVQWRDVNLSIRRERRGERSSVYPKSPPAAYSCIYKGWTRANLIQP